MSMFARREMIAWGYSIGAISMLVGGVLRFTRSGPAEHFFAYLLVAGGVLLVFTASLVRGNGASITLLRYLLAAFAALTIIGVVFKDAIARLV